MINGFVLGGRFQAEIGKSVSLVENYPIALRHQHRSAHHALLLDHPLCRGIQALGCLLGMHRKSAQSEKHSERKRGQAGRDHRDEL